MSRVNADFCVIFWIRAWTTLDSRHCHLIACFACSCSLSGTSCSKYDFHSSFRWTETPIRFYTELCRDLPPWDACWYSSRHVERIASHASPVILRSLSHHACRCVFYLIKPIAYRPETKDQTICISNLTHSWLVKIHVWGRNSVAVRQHYDNDEDGALASHPHNPIPSSHDKRISSRRHHVCEVCLF